MSTSIFETKLVHSEYPEEQYGAWEETYYNTLSHIKKGVHDGDVFASSVDVDLTVPTIVWAEWSIGNSFGMANNGTVETMGIFQNSDHAKEFKEFCKRRN